MSKRSQPLAEHYYLRVSATDIYLLVKADVHVPQGGYKLFVYSAKDLNAGNNFDLRDASGDWLTVLSFDNDPATGDAFIAGCIINPKRQLQFTTADDYSYSPYLGLFTLDLGGPDKDMHVNCSYWSDKKFPGISEDGWFSDKNFYVKYATAFRDYNGNTIFAGTAIVEKQSGADKFKLADGVFVRQETSGKLVLDNNIPCDETKYFSPGWRHLYTLDKKDFYRGRQPGHQNQLYDHRRRREYLYLQCQQQKGDADAPAQRRKCEDQCLPCQRGAYHGI